jgi:hypothetical protein
MKINKNRLCFLPIQIQLLEIENTKQKIVFPECVRNDFGPILN